MSESGRQRVVAFVPDLMDRSRLSTSAIGADLRFVTTLAGMGDEEADVMVVDLSRPGVLEAIPTLARGGRRIVGFGSHVDRDLLAAARDAGCDTVLPRSAFFASPERWLP